MCFGEDQRALRALVPLRHAAVVALGVITEIGFSLESLVWAAVGARVPFRTLMLIRVVILQRPSIYQDYAMLVRKFSQQLLISNLFHTLPEIRKPLPTFWIGALQIRVGGWRQFPGSRGCCTVTNINILLDYELFTYKLVTL